MPVTDVFQYCSVKKSIPPTRAISWGAKSFIKSPNLAGDLGGSILVKNQNLRSIEMDFSRRAWADMRLMVVQLQSGILGRL
jgi:hypothetical protein